MQCSTCPPSSIEQNGQCLVTDRKPKGNGRDCDSTPNPVQIGTGNKWQHEIDISHGATLDWARYYNSTAPLASVNIGTGWTHTYARSINSQSSISWMLVRRQDGKAFNFNPVSGGWLSDADIADRLTELKNASGIRTGWRYTVAADDSIETYSAAGKLLSIADRAGRLQTLTYDLPAASGGDDNPNTLDTVTDDTGRQLAFSYDANKRLATVTDPAGGIITYGYDSQNNLTTVTYPDGRSKTYHYNEPENTSGADLPHALTGITDEKGDRYATYQYSADGKAIATGHANGADLYTLSYGTNSTTVTDPLGTPRTHNFQTILGVAKSTGVSQPGGSGCGPASSATTYDANGNVASRADFNGHKSCYAYDLTRNLETARVEGLASGSVCPTNLATYTPAPNTAERKILTTWHATFRLPLKVTEAGRETSTVYDSRGNVTSRSIEDLASGQTRTWTTTYTYHATVPGVLVQKIENGPRTDVSDLITTDYYAPDENCLGGHYGCRGQVRQVTNALGHVTTYNDYDPHGRVLRTTDPNGLVTTMAYSLRGWLTSRDVGGELTQFDYDYVGQLTRLTRPDGSFVSFEYDPAHRLTAIVQQDGSRVTYTLDAAGNRIQEDITGPAGGTVYYTHRRSFDTLGRLWQDIGATNQTVTYEYDAKGNMKQIDGARTDVADLTRHSYDPLDRLTQTLNADSGIEQTTVNALDQTTRVVDPANQATQHTVNALGDILQTVSADTGTTVRTYDTGGNLKTEKDARGITVTYTWDALNRLTQKQSSAAATPIYKYVYDTCGAGRLCSTLIGSTPDITFAYDALGRIAARYENGGIATHYAYRPGGQIEGMTYPTGRGITYSHDAQGRVSQVATQPTTGTPVTVLASNFVYGYPFAGPQSFQYGNGQGFNQSRDQDYRPTASVDGTRNKLLSYDLAGNIASLADISTTMLTYAYDATGRLTSALDSAPGSFGTLGYSYDQNGNRIVETRNASDLPYVYNPAGSNWLYQKGSEIRSKTASGNTASIGGLASFTYDGFNRLATSATAAETTTYLYNAFGERMKKSNQYGLSTVFHYGANGELLWEKDANGNTKAYVWLEGRPLARIDNDAEIYYYHVDHLGTPQAMSDSTGSLVWKAAYEPFGKATVSAASTVENNLRFPGQYYDRETGLHYNTFRDYEPGTGRYVQSDPIGLAGGINPYLYVDADPLRKVDPLGLAGIAIGISGNGFVATMGLGGGSALVFDPANGNICYQAQICTRAGLGLAFTVTANLGLNSGPTCPGTTSSAGLFGTGGVGLAGLGSVRASTTGSGGSVTSGALGGLGAGWGMAGGGEACYTTLVCLKEPECCKCGNCGSSSAGGSIGSITAP